MSKKSSSALSEPEIAPTEHDEVIRIPVTYGGTLRTADHDRVGIVADRGKRRLSLSPRAELHPHVADWRFVRVEFLSNGAGEITGVELIKAERGFIVRRSSSGRPQFIIALTDVTVTPVDHGGSDDIAETVGTVEGDALMFTLPKVIKGKYESFKLTRRS
jgi:hypothetical protein